MGGLFHFFDFNQGNMARKIFSHKRHVGGLDAPRNSLELQLENSQSYCAVDDPPYSYQVEEDWAAKNCFQTEASMKKLIHEEMSKQSNTRKNAPSIVARLMGMDAFPLDTKPIVLQSVEKKNDNQRDKFCKREKDANDSDGHLVSNSTYSKKTDVDLVYSSRERHADRWSTGQKLEKPRPREHPQEEELQKFKKDFTAWQASRLRECSKLVDVGSIPTSREKLSKEMIALYADSEERKHEKPLESKRFAVKENLHELGLHRRHNSEPLTAEQKEPRRRCVYTDFQLPSMIHYNEKVDAAATRIVILRPGPDRIYDHEESQTSSSGTFDERSGIEDFLEEVKERLKLELQGQTLKRSDVVRGSGIETPFSEKPSDPRQIAKHIAKQVREKVSRDTEMNLMRSTSTKSYRSEIQFNGPSSPEFINENTRRFLSERLKNVQKHETQVDLPIVCNGSSRPSAYDNGRARLKQIQDTQKSRNEQSWEMVKDEHEMQTRSFRHGDRVGILNKELSPRNLIRSFSAPVSGTSFGKLLLEDRHVLTGAQIRRKHEGIENVPVDVGKRKREKFNLKEKVSNIKYGLALRRRLFGRKIQSMVETYGAYDYPAKDILSGPTVMSMNFSDRHENSTEVPPSPASVCSSTNEEFWRQVDYLSPLSTPDMNFGEENGVPKVFKEISSNLNELRRQLNEPESDGVDNVSIEQESCESEMGDVDDQVECYVRDLLVASGLYGGSCDKSFSRWDPLAKPISNSVFEQVEESYRKSDKENDSSKNDEIEKEVDRKALLDLLNEALATVLGPQVTMSRFRRKLLGSSILPPPRGRKLLNYVWEIIQINLYPPNDICHYSLDTMVARDLGSIPWNGLMDDETNVLGREVECHIIGELVEEIVKDMYMHY